MKNLHLNWTEVRMILILSMALLCISYAAASPAEDKQQLKYDNTPLGLTLQGHPYRGDAQAPVTIEEYSDYLCPFCSRHYQQTLPALFEKYISSGKVKYVFRDFPIASLHPTAAISHAATLCAAEQNQVFFWNMHDSLFQNQNDWRRLTDPTDFLAKTAQDVGVDMGAYKQCMASKRQDKEVEKSIKEAQTLGFNGTPTFRFSRSGSDKSYTLSGAQGIKVFSEWIDKLLAGAEPPVAKTPELPFWAIPEGLAPDAERPGFNVAGDAYKGNIDAELAVVEFSDFQCPPCRQHALETMLELDKQFIATGKLLWVFKHLPLKEHPHAAIAAAAAECAGEQNKFWDMHHLLFEKQADWSTGNADAKLLKLARQLKLDMPDFEQCFNGRTALEHVLKDIYDAQGIVKKTPTFVLLYEGKGHKMQGAKAAKNLAAIIEKKLQKIDAGND